jgi:hypothetical protein
MPPTITPAKLPCPAKVTCTGKKVPGSSPPTVNIKEPVRSSIEMSGMDQVREWVEGLSDHSPLWEETVG